MIATFFNKSLFSKSLDKITKTKPKHLYTTNPLNYSYNGIDKLVFQKAKAEEEEAREEKP